MLENPTTAVLALSSHLAKDILQLLAPHDIKEVRHHTAEQQAHTTEPICLGDAGWLDHYGHRHHDVDVERL
ncbi:MAG: hypothetical protein EPN20_09740 [Magnetospirillum sp.]|nr:MAG: hypothetical protein EPN20_09740 [Magnetospirillum sp.]